MGSSDLGQAPTWPWVDLGQTAALVGLLGLGLALASCQGPPPVVFSAVCPPPIAYSGADLHRAEVEMKGLPPDSMIVRMILDYGVERKVLRACRGVGS